MAPPNLEEAYRRKCIQLKERTKEIEEENDAYKLRIDRLKRQIQKSRFERAILLEQIAKRTSTNVEDSEGSPSPPPTPKEKPLRIKRGHRKPSTYPGDGADAGSSFVSANMGRGLSPTNSEALSHADHPHRNGNGAAPKPPKRPSNAFEIYCNDTRPVLQNKHKDTIAAGEFRLEEELARGWKDLPQDQKDEFQSRYEQELQKWKEDREAFRRSTRDVNSRDRSRQGRDSFYASRGKNGAAAARRSREQDSEVVADEDGDQDVDDHDVEMAEAEAEEQRDSDPETEVDMDNETADNNADEDQ